jgi:hypothetical protein
LKSYSEFGLFFNKAFKYEKLVVPMLNAIQEQKQEINALKDENSIPK